MSPLSQTPASTALSRQAPRLVSTEGGVPLANAGPDRFGKPGGSVALDGGGSSDPRGDALAASWANLGLGDQLAGTIAAR